MSGNTLTIVSAVAGIVVGFLTSWWFTRSSKRTSEAEQVRLLKEISTLRSLLANVAESVTKSLVPDVKQAFQSVKSPDRDADTVTTSLRSVTSTSALDVVVRAAIGTLIDEHGQVSVARLLRTVASGIPDASSSEIASSLNRLQEAGKVSWFGNDVMKAGVIKVHP